jgi:hypothetical protein
MFSLLFAGATFKKEVEEYTGLFCKQLRSDKPATGQRAKYANRYINWQWAKQMEVFRLHLCF